MADSARYGFRPRGFISDNPPGICSQTDFDHDVHALMTQMSFLLAISTLKGYKIELTDGEFIDLKKFMGRLDEDA